MATNITDLNFVDAVADHHHPDSLSWQEAIHQ
jgi:hypothetical protein